MSPKKSSGSGRPRFLEALSEAYGLRRENVVILTGDIHGLFHGSAAESYLPLEPLLHREMAPKFNLIRLDLSSGLGFYDLATEHEVIRICESKDGSYTPRGRVEALQSMIESSRHNPLAALVLLRGIADAFHRVRQLEPDTKPLCAIMSFAGAIFPPGDYGRLSELDRQRLVAFLSWVSSSPFFEGPDLIILISHVKSELNGKIASLANCGHIEIELPNQRERLRFVRHFAGKRKGMRFVGGKERFAEDTAGMTLSHVKDVLEVAARTKKPLTRERVVKEVNDILQAELGDIIRIKYPAHKPKDIIGYKQTGAILKEIFERCEDPETAVSAMLVSGPNGAGKTFQLEAYAAASGRVVIELAGIRGSYFGETDRFFELLRWHIVTFGKILILVDEAHTAFGSVHAAETHQTEQRLSGNIIKMMGNPSYLGKVLWAMMTSRPDELDPDIKSRAPVQIPVFDLEGEERRAFVVEMFRRKKIPLPGSEIEPILGQTDYYSARDYRNFVAEVLAQKRKAPKRSALDVLSGWQASKSIKRQREFQTLLAALHCSYPKLLPEPYRDIEDAVLIQRSETLKRLLRQ